MIEESATKPMNEHASTDMRVLPTAVERATRSYLCNVSSDVTLRHCDWGGRQSYIIYRCWEGCVLRDI